MSTDYNITYRCSGCGQELEKGELVYSLAPTQVGERIPRVLYCSIECLAVAFEDERLGSWGRRKHTDKAVRG